MYVLKITNYCVYIYTMELYSFIKNNEIMPFMSNRVELGKISMCSKPSQTWKGR